MWLLLGRLKLSRHNVILCGKFINQMADSSTSKDQLEMIDQLRERQARSWKRWRSASPRSKTKKKRRKAGNLAGPQNQKCPRRNLLLRKKMFRTW